MIFAKGQFFKHFSSKFKDVSIYYHIEQRFGGVMSFEKNSFKVVKKKRLQKSELNVECNIPVDGEINKIFSVCHTAMVENLEVLSGAVNFNGNIDFCILYEATNGEILTNNYSCPFSSKIEDEKIAVGDKVQVDVEVVDFSVDNATNSNIKINCLLMQKGVIISCYDIETIDTNDEDICSKKEEIYLSTFIGEASEVFTATSEVSIKEPVRKVVLCDASVSVKNVECGNNFVSVTGEVIGRLLYLTENDRYETSYINENFKEEVELEGVTRNSVAEAFVNIKRNQMKCEVVEQERGVVVKLDIPVCLKVCAFEERACSVIKDIYSCKEDIEISTESFDTTKELSQDFFETKIDGTLNLDENHPRVDKLLFVAGTNLIISNSYIQNGELYVEGVAKANVVYLNDEENSLHSVTMEVPFVVSDKTSVACENPEISISAVLYDVDVIVKKGRDLYFDGKLKIHARYDCEEICAVITSANLTGDTIERDCSIELIYAKSGMEAWDIAKQFKVREEVLMLQNPEVAFPLTEDTNVIVYYQKTN